MNKKWFLAYILMLPACGCSKKERALHYYEQAVVHAQQKTDTALLHINRALALHKHPHYVGFKATLLYQMQAFDESRALLSSLINNKKVDPQVRAQALNTYAAILLHEGKKRDATFIWKGLLASKHYPAKETLWLNVGLAALADAHIQEAISCFNHALKRDPEYVDALFFKATAQKHAGRKKDARATIEQLLRIHPMHQAARTLLARCST